MSQGPCRFAPHHMIFIQEQRNEVAFHLFHEIHGHGDGRSPSAPFAVLCGQFLGHPVQRLAVDCANDLSGASRDVVVEQVEGRQVPWKGEFRQALAGLLANGGVRAVEQFDDSRQGMRHASVAQLPEGCDLDLYVIIVQSLHDQPIRRHSREFA